MAARWNRSRLFLTILFLGVVPGILAGCGGGPQLALPAVARFEIGGTVTAADGTALANASVVMAGSPLGTLTEDDGQFNLRNVRAGVYRLTVVYLGYRSRHATLRVPETGEGSFTLDLVRDPSLGPALARETGPVTVALSIRSQS